MMQTRSAWHDNHALRGTSSRHRSRRRASLIAATVLLSLASARATAAGQPVARTADAGRMIDSIVSARTRTTTRTATAPDTAPLRLVVSLADRALYAMRGSDTVRTASVGVGMDSTLTYAGRVWRFTTPRGRRRVIAKESDPTWAPPDWHYVEMARARGLQLATLSATRPLTLADGSEIVVRNGSVGLVRPGIGFTPFAEGEEIIWDGTLYIPPLGTKQRRIAGELGRYRLDLGDGYLVHGTPYLDSIGQPSSHGCIRVGDDDIAWLYANVPVGTSVEIR